MFTPRLKLYIGSILTVDSYYEYHINGEDEENEFKVRRVKRYVVPKRGVTSTKASVVKEEAVA